MSLGKRRKNQETCAHPLAVTTMIAGLRRTVCDTCGKVSLTNATDVVTNQAFQKQKIPVSV